MHHLGDPAAGFDNFRVNTSGAFVPPPSVLERLNLRCRLRPITFCEQHVVAGVRVEGRIEVDQVDGLVVDVATEDVQVVAVVELVLGHGRSRCIGHPAWQVYAASSSRALELGFDRLDSEP